MIFYSAFVEGKLDAPKSLLPEVHRLYFEPQYTDFSPRTLREFRAIHSLLTKAFIRRLAHPSEEAIKDLPDNDPAVIEFENRLLTNRLVFYLGRTAADDFSELLILGGNGYGVGALKILRGMYERIVTASYIAGNPSEARVFAEDDVIKKWKLWQEYSTAMPELKARYTEEQMRDLEQRYRAIRAKRKEEICTKVRPAQDTGSVD